MDNSLTVCWSMKTINVAPYLKYMRVKHLVKLFSPSSCLSRYHRFPCAHPESTSCYWHKKNPTPVADLRPPSSGLRRTLFFNPIIYSHDNLCYVFYFIRLLILSMYSVCKKAFIVPCMCSATFCTALLMHYRGSNDIGKMCLSLKLHFIHVHAMNQDAALSRL